MTTLLHLTAGFAAFSLAAHVASHGLALAHLLRRDNHIRSRDEQPLVSLVRPLSGIETFSEETLEASFRLTYPNYELIFCVARGGDPVIPLVEAAIARHKHVPARLLVGEEKRSGNPKLDNMAKGCRAACGEFVVFADSNLLVPEDYLQRIIGSFRPDTAVVSAPPFGAAPGSLAAEVECALLNSYAARIQYCVASVGFGFAQGKTLAFRKADLDDGGFEAMALEPAEDAAATKWARSQGRKVRLVSPAFPQPLGQRSAGAVWSRHLRWARLRRATFPLLFAPEILSSALAPFAALVVAAWLAGLPAAPLLAAYILAWYGADVLATRLAGWPLSLRTLAALPIRDLLIAAIWFAAWTGRGFVWHGHAMKATAQPHARA